MNDSSRMFTYSDPIGENDNLTSVAARYRDTEDPETLALFLHLFEPNINKVVGSAVKTYGHVSLYEDLKLACVFAIMDKLPRFDPEKGTVENYLKYPMMHAVQEEIRYMRSGFPISTKSTDPLLRKIMWLYHENNDRHDPEALAEIGRQVNRKPKTVLRYILDGTTNEIIYEEDERDKKKREDEEKEDPLLTARGNPEWEPENSLLQSEQSSMVIPPFAALGNVNRDIVSRMTIPGALFECDPTRPYLPSSPYYSPEVVALGFDQHALPEDHLWGPRGYYKDSFYKEATCLFASETGYHGMPCRESLEEMFSPENVYPWSDTSAHVWKDAWLTKSVRESPAYGYVPKRNNLMINQVNILFGEVPDDLDRFIEASQTVQAEALKYFIERFRIAKFAPRTGILWWNIRDGWPIISDAVVDWYDRPKKACAYIRNAQKDVCAMIGDAEGKGHPLVVANDTREAVSGTVSVTDAASGKRIYSGRYEVAPNARTEVARLRRPSGQGVWVIRYSAPGGEQVNHYLYGEPPFDLDAYGQWMHAIFP